MRKIAFLLLPLVLLTNCKAATTEAANPDKYYQPEASNVPGADGKGNSKNSKIAHGEPLSPFNADGSVKAQFPEATLLRLNDIVRGSKATIDKYDEIRPDLEQLIAKVETARNNKALAEKAAAGVAEVSALQKKSIAAREALSAEGQKLLDSGQYYDAVVFSGMAAFVTKVEKELTTDVKLMNETLGKK